MTTTNKNMQKAHRGTIHYGDATVLRHDRYPGGQYVLRLEAPECARAATPGSFVHLQCAATIPMRRPLSILGAHPVEGWIEVLYKVVGQGLQALSATEPGARLSLLGPIGQGFRPDPARPVALLIGGGVGIPPLMFLADSLARQPGSEPWSPLAFFGSELPLPFDTRAAQLAVDGLPPDATGTLTRMEELGVPCRLSSFAGLPGCHAGYVTALAGAWIHNQPAAARDRMTIYACGPTPMLRAVQQLAAGSGLPSQLCLEEFMACAVGGCAGCVVPVLVNGERQMKRVCVDGPVFDGRSVEGFL